MKKLKHQKSTIIACMLIYLACLLYITLFTRNTGTVRVQKELFWSYKALLEGNNELGKLISLNIGLFVPFGFLVSMILDKTKAWVNVLLTVVISFAVSAAVEYSQLIFHLGLFEYDDMFSNTLGGFIGGLCSVGVRRHLPKVSVWLAVACCVVGIIAAISVIGGKPRPGYVFQIDEIRDGKIIGFCFMEDAEVQEDVKVYLKDTKSKKRFELETSYGISREDVNEYFGENIDYTRTGYEAVMDVPEGREYEVLVKFGEMQPMSTGVYIPERRDAGLKVAGTDLEKIVREGFLLVDRPERHCWVYQFEGELYWIVNDGFDFEDDGSTYVQYQLWTTTPGRLPKKRTDNGWFWDNIGGNFEDYEVTGEMDCGEYRVMKRELPAEYAITSIVTGYYKNEDWVWKEYFRPRWEF